MELGGLAWEVGCRSPSVGCCGPDWHAVEMEWNGRGWTGMECHGAGWTTRFELRAIVGDPERESGHDALRSAPSWGYRR